MDESRYMFDQLAIVSPIMLALSASTPIHRGMLADTDARWNCISAAVDDRTEEELRPSSAAAADATQGGVAATSGEGQMQERDWFGGEQGRARVGGEGVAGDVGGARRHPKSRWDVLTRGNCVSIGFNDIDFALGILRLGRRILLYDYLLRPKGVISGSAWRRALY